MQMKIQPGPSNVWISDRSVAMRMSSPIVVPTFDDRRRRSSLDAQMSAALTNSMCRENLD
jgi:hypothetical protein